jgi:hypothetical protein
MLTNAQRTQHEKIIRGLVIVVGSFTMGVREEADGTIQMLLTKKVCRPLFFQ